MRKLLHAIMGPSRPTIHDMAAEAARAGRPVWRTPEGAHGRWLGFPAR